MRQTRNRPPKLRLRWGRIGLYLLIGVTLLMWLFIQQYMIHLFLFTTV